MSFPDLFKRAFALWWRTRGLWPLGMLAALMGGSDYTTGGLNLNVPTQSDTGAALPPGLAEQLAESALVRSIIENPLIWLVGLIAVLLVWTIVAVLVIQLAQGAMIGMVDRADRGYQATLGDALRTGAARLLPMFLLGLLLGLPLLLIIGLLVVLVVAGVAAFTSAALDGSGSGVNITAAVGGVLLCVIPLFLLTLVLSLAISLFNRTAQCVCVLEGRGPIASLRRSWSLVTRNFGNAILAWLSTAILTGLFGFFASLPLLVFGFPVLFDFVRNGTIPWLFLIGAGLYSLVVTVLIGGWLTSFNFALWTVAYRSFAVREQGDPVPASYAPGD